MTDDLERRLREKAQQVAAAKRSLHGLPILVTESDTCPGRSALWMDNGFAGVGQVAISTGEFPCVQTDAVAALANVAASFDFDEAADEIARLRAENEALREALGPFAACMEYINDDEDGEEWAKFRLLIKDYRRARTALEGSRHE